MNTPLSILFSVLTISILLPLNLSAQDNPWSVPAAWDVEEQDITFESGGIMLSGTLYSPNRIPNGPAVVVVQQAGTETRDNPLFLQIAQTFNSIGFSVLLYDLRGHG